MLRKHVKLLGSLFFCAVLVSGVRYGNASPDLRSLYDAHDWFRLRDALVGADAKPLYAGAVAAAFDHINEAEASLRPVIDAAPDSDDAADASSWLSYLYLRHGEYQKAAAEMEENSPLAAILRNLPDQSTARVQPGALSSRIYRNKLYVPVNVQGKSAELFIDSDANFSFLSESAARSLGLTVRGADTGTVHGASGAGAAVRIAVADQLTLGNVEIKNVVFMVLSDAEEVFQHLGPSQQGALGLQVLVALRSVRFSRDGQFEVGAAAGNATEPGQNLCFDGVNPVALIRFQQQKLPVVLDTGAEMTELWPPFARQFSEIVNSSGRSGSTFERGFGGRSHIANKVIPDVVLRVGGFDAHLRAAQVLLSSTTPDSQRYYARLGLDVLNLAHQVTIDFQSLTLTLQQ